MSRSGKTTEFLKECMADALLKLMGEKPLEKISVQEITETAGVGRATWFRHFAAKSEAISFKLTRLWGRWTAAHGMAEHQRYTLNDAGAFFQFNFEIRRLHSAIYAAGQQSAIYGAFYQIMMPQRGANAQECYSSRFFSYGLFGLLDEWIKRDFSETPEEMTRLFWKIMGAKDA